MMRKLLLASSACMLSASFAYADVTITGDGRMGIKDDFDPKDFGLMGETDPGFTSRIRIAFGASGETDNGLSFGGSVRADNAGGGASGTAGSVFVSGAFGTFSMGDVDGGAKTAVGHVDGVGLTGLGDLNEIFYFANAGSDPALLYSHTVQNLSVHFSADNPSAVSEAFAAGVSYKLNDDVAFAAGYERAEDTSIEFSPLGITDLFGDADAEQFVLGASGNFAGMTAKLVYGDGESDDGGVDHQQYAVSLGYTADNLSLTGFIRNYENDGAILEVDATAYGIGASYDLGGDAALKVGFSNLDADGFGDSTAFDAGISFTF